jgi:hypothetical protein
MLVVGCSVAWMMIHVTPVSAAAAATLTYEAEMKNKTIASTMSKNVLDDLSLRSLVCRSNC